MGKVPNTHNTWAEWSLLPYSAETHHPIWIVYKEAMHGRHSTRASPTAKNQQKFGYEKNLWRSSDPNPSIQKGHPQPAAQDHVQMAFKYLQAWRLHHHPGQPVHLHSKRSVSWCSEGTCSVTACPLVPGLSLGTTEKSLTPVSLHPSLRYLIHIDEISPSLLFSMLNNSSSLSFSS